MELANTKPISWSYNADDIVSMEDTCAACDKHGEACKSCTIARVLSECYMNELRDEGMDVSIDDAFSMLFE